MKKSIFLFFAAILCAMTANAQLYLRGGFNNWNDLTADYQFVSNVCNLELPGGTTYEFKIADSGWGTNFGGDHEFTATATNTLTSGGGNMKITTTIPGTYKFEFVQNTKKLTVTYPEVPAPHDITVRAKVPASWTNTITAWVWTSENGAGEEVTPTKDGDYYVVTKNAGALYVIFKNGAGWTGQAKNQTVDLCYTEDVCLQINQSGDANATATVIDCGAVAKDITVKAVVPGAWENTITAWVWPTGGEGKEVTPTKDGNWYVVTENCIELNVIFKNGTGWNGDANQTVNIEGVSENACYQISALNKEGGKCSVTKVDCDAVIEPEAKPEPTPTYEYYITGSFNGWNEKDPAHGMTLDGEVYKATVTLAAGENLVKVTNGTWTDAKGFSAMGAEYDEVSAGASDDNIMVTLAAGKDVVVVYNATTKKVTFEGLTEKAPSPTFDYYITGSFNSNNPKKAENGMTLDGTVYKATVTLAEGDNTLKVTDGTWEKTWGANELGAAYDEVSNPNDYNNIKITLAAEKEITVIFDATAGKITFEGLTPYVAPLTYTVTVPAGTEKCYIAGNMNGWAFQEMEAVTGETNKFTITIVGAKETDEYKYACQADWAYAEVIDGGGNRTNWSELDEVTAWNKPAVITYQLKGVGGWDQPGIELVQNPDPEKASEYMLTCQAISATDAIKVVRLEDGVIKDYYGNGTVKDGVEVTVNYDGDGNITLPAGTYNFYFDTAESEKKLWIEAATDCVTEPTEKTIVEENAVCTIGRDGSLTMEGQELYVEIGEFDAENVLPEYIAVCTLLSTWDGGTCEAATATLNDNVLTLTGTFVTEESGETYKFTISGELPSGEVESKEVNVVVANLVVEYDSDSEVWVLFGTDDEYTFTLALNEEPVAEKEYTLNEDNSQVRYSRYRSFVTGSLTKQHDDTYGDMYVGQLSATFDDVPYTISLTMYNYTVVDAEPIDLFAEATYTIEDDMLTVVADWEGTPVQGILVGFENVSGQKIDEVWLSVGEGENEFYISGSAVVTIEDGELAIEGVFSFADEEYYNVYIWGDIPATEPTPDYTRTVTIGQWGTICLPNASSSFTGATFYEVSSLDPEKGLWLDQLADGTQLEAGKPYIFQATAAQIAVVYTGAAKAAPVAGKNGLTGTFTDIAANGVLVDNYVIAQNQVWVAGTGATLPANCAYINATLVPKKAQAVIPGRRRVCMGENAATGLDQIVAPEGQAVKAIVNGQLIIIRDGVKYNVQGQVIK